MKKYANIPEVWVYKVDRVVYSLRDETNEILRIFKGSDLFSQHLKSEGYERRNKLCDLVSAFSTRCEEWVWDHPVELRFMFEKMCCGGWTAVKKWHLSNCLELKNLADVDDKIASIPSSRDRIDVQNVLDIRTPPDYNEYLST